MSVHPSVCFVSFLFILHRRYFSNVRFMSPTNPIVHGASDFPDLCLML